MNEMPRLQQWAIKGALGLILAVSSGAFAATPTEPNSDALQQVLTQLLEEQSSNVPIDVFYQHRAGSPAWQHMAAVEALVSALKTLEHDGLTPDDYFASTLLSEFQHSQQAGKPAQAAFELKATYALLLALEHLGRGKVNPRDIEPTWTLKRPDNRYAMQYVIDAVDDQRIEDAFALVRPSTPAYTQLRQALSDYRQLNRQGSVPLLAERAQSLRVGERSADVVVLRQRLALWGESQLIGADSGAYPMVNAQSAVRDPHHFDQTLERAVIRFQQRHQLLADGVVGPQTRSALNTSIASRIEQLKVNLERARWLGSSLSDAPQVWVDIAGYRLHYLRPNGQHWETRVVVGTPQRATPTLHSSISHLTVNPSWTIPPTIMREDVLPKVRQDPHYLEQQRIHVLNLAGDRLAAEDIDWQQPGAIMLRQVPSHTNPLGRVVVRFPNDEMIYLHDTPATGLFQRQHRALSSGCVRVEGVTAFAQMLLSDSGSHHQLSTLMNSSASDRNVNLPRRIPVALHYMTAWPNASGDVEFREDIYRRDGALLHALSNQASNTRF